MYPAVKDERADGGPEYAWLSRKISAVAKGLPEVGPTQLKVLLLQPAEADGVRTDSPGPPAYPSPPFGVGVVSTTMIDARAGAVTAQEVKNTSIIGVDARIEMMSRDLEADGTRNLRCRLWSWVVRCPSIRNF